MQRGLCQQYEEQTHELCLDTALSGHRKSLHPVEAHWSTPCSRSSDTSVMSPRNELTF